MKSRNIGLLLLFLLIALNIGASGYYYARLPERVASEFDLAGEPKSWMTKGTFVIFNIALLILFPAFMLAVSWLSTKLPKRMIDMPNRDYWFAPERRAETAASVMRFMLWMAVGAEVFLTVIVGMVYRANFGRPEIMRWGPWIALGGFSPFLIAWIVCFYLRFKRVPPA
jgi:uncharacterized membrane protein